MSAFLTEQYQYVVTTIAQSGWIREYVVQTLQQGWGDIWIELSKYVVQRWADISQDLRGFDRLLNILQFTFEMFPPWYHILAFFPIVFVIINVGNQSKFIAALAQMISIQNRNDVMSVSPPDAQSSFNNQGSVDSQDRQGSHTTSVKGSTHGAHYGRASTTSGSVKSEQGSVKSQGSTTSSASGQGRGEGSVMAAQDADGTPGGSSSSRISKRKSIGHSVGFGTSTRRVSLGLVNESSNLRRDPVAQEKEKEKEKGAEEKEEAKEKEKEAKLKRNSFSIPSVVSSEKFESEPEKLERLEGTLFSNAASPNRRPAQQRLSPNKHTRSSGSIISGVPGFTSYVNQDDKYDKVPPKSAFGSTLPTTHNSSAFGTAACTIEGMTSPKKAISDTGSSGSSTVVPPLSPRSMRRREKTLKENKLILSIAKSKDKLWWMVGMGDCVVTAYSLGIAPHLMYLYYTPKITFFIVLRWYTFVKKRQHYLLYDFCYWANLLCLVYCWLVPGSSWVFRITFMNATGPLAFASLCFNHALILHSYAHMTSVIVHVSPLILMYGLRWHVYDDIQGFNLCGEDLTSFNRKRTDGSTTGSSSWFSSRSTNDELSCQNVGHLQLVYEAMTGFYVWWSVFYFLWIFVALGSYIERKQYQTLWDRILTQGSIGRMLKRMLTKYPKIMVQMVYLLIHLIYSVITMLFASILFHHQVGHFVFVLVICGSCAWNAAEFYSQALGPMYEQALDEVRQHHSISSVHLKILMSASMGLTDAVETLQAKKAA